MEASGRVGVRYPSFDRNKKEINPDR